MGSGLGKRIVPEYKWTGESSHRFYKSGATDMLDVFIINLEVGLYLKMEPEKAIVKVEKEKKHKHLQVCL